MAGFVDEKYYQAAHAGSIAERLLIRARANIFADFEERMRPAQSDRILDVGVSDVINAGANVLERLYAYPEQITACGIGTAEEFQAVFPKCNYVRIDANQRLPFEDGSFEVATSNAVLEHVGSFENQLFFVSELCRVARRVFISVPNRYFIVEHHTSLPFVHYSDNLFRFICYYTGNSEWAEETNLILMSRKRLRQLSPTVGKRTTVGYTGLRLGPLSSNIFITFE